MMDTLRVIAKMMKIQDGKVKFSIHIHINIPPQTAIAL
jgi:hypothetical protein